MDYLHLTHKKNLNSILKYGLLTSYVKNDDHWDIFKKYNLKKRKCIYMWDGETFNNTKFIKDMIYTKFFIHPRNEIFVEKEKDGKYIDFNNFGNKIFGEDSLFYLIKIFNFEDYFGDFQHMQSPSDDKYSTCTIMDDKYAHDDKRVHISDRKINPQSFDIIEEINTRIYKNKELGFTFRKYKK
jgi:hypothetical protein